MDSFELNKVAGAVLGTLLFAFGTGFLAELIYHPKPAGNAGYALPGGGEAEHGGGGGETAAAPKAETVAVRLASADAEKGKAGTKACAACHNFEKDGPNKIGPALWNVVERPKASHAGFDYSAALKEKGGTWTYDDLDHFLESPKGYAKGTKMAFQGIGDAKQRADVILYLHTLSESPKLLPAAEKEGAKKEEGKPADGKAAEGKAEDKKVESGKADGKKPGGQADQKAGTTANTNAQNGEDAAKKTQPAQPAAGESADTDRPGGSGKAKSQIETGTNPPEAAPAGGSADSTPKAAEDTPPKTEAPAKADPAAEKKVQEMKDGTGETKAQ